MASVLLTDLLSESEHKRLASWKEEQLVLCRKIQKLEPNEVLDVGAMGGLYTFMLTPVSLGLVIKVVNNITKNILDLSDYDSW